MKKNAYLILLLVFMGTYVKSQDTVVGWTFNTNDSTSLIANFGDIQNAGIRMITAEDTLGNIRSITLTNGIIDYAATSVNWHEGTYCKFWQIEFNSSGYENLKLSSKQRATNTAPGGPKYFKVQYSIGGITFMDIPGVDTITCANNWTSGVITNISLPAECNDTSELIYIRWIMLSNESITGPVVDSTVGSKIDDIFVTGSIIPSLINNYSISTMCEIYPNPASEKLFFKADYFNRKLTIIDILGNIIFETITEDYISTINVNHLKSGVYFIKYEHPKLPKPVIKKFIIE